MKNNCIKYVWPILVFCIFQIACNIPKDPENSWEHARMRGLRVGVVTNPPFTKNTAAGFQGPEIAMLNQFAQSKGMKMNFEAGNESELVKKLENFELDLLVGGFEKSTNWKTKVGMSAPYDNKHVIFLPKGENKLLYELESYLQNKQMQ